VPLNPVQTDAAHGLFIREAKTDSIDALVITEIVRFGRYKPSNVPQDKLSAPRGLRGDRFCLIDMGSELKRRVAAPLGQIFPDFESQFDKMFCKPAVTILIVVLATLLLYTASEPIRK